MTNDERDIFQILGEAASAKGAGLSDASRDRLRGSVASFVRENPPAEGVEVRPFCRPGTVCSPWMTFFMAEVRASPAFVALLAAIFVGGGVSYAAEGAVPGDSLYWVKTEVNEPVGDLLVAGEAQLNWDVRKIERRLDETTILAAEGRFDAEAEAEVAERVEEGYRRFAENAKEMREENLVAALSAGADVEATLRAHGIVIEQINGEVADKFAGRALVWADAAVVARAEAEATAEEEELRAAADRKAAAAAKRIEAARLAAAGSGASTTARSRAEVQLKLAAEAFDAGLSQASSSDYRASFGSYQRAHELAQESSLIILAASFGRDGKTEDEDGDEDEREDASDDGEDDRAGKADEGKDDAADGRDGDDNDGDDEDTSSEDSADEGDGRGDGDDADSRDKDDAEADDGDEKSDGPSAGASVDVKAGVSSGAGVSGSVGGSAGIQVSL